MKADRYVYPAPPTCTKYFHQYQFCWHLTQQSTDPQNCESVHITHLYNDSQFDEVIMISEGSRFPEEALNVISPSFRSALIMTRHRP